MSQSFDTFYICLYSIPEVIEEQDKQLQVEATSNPDFNDSISETNENKTVNNETQDELNKDDDSHVHDENIDETDCVVSDGHKLPVSEEEVEEEIEEEVEKTKLEDENQQEMLKKDNERKFQENLNNLGIISAHHDGYVRFWNSQVY